MSDEHKILIEQLEKRLEDLRGYLTILIASAGGLIGLATIIFAWNLNSERDALRDFQSRIERNVDKKIEVIDEKLLQQAITDPKFELLNSVSKAALDQSIVNAWVVEVSARDERDDGSYYSLKLPFILSNVGKHKSSEIEFAIYSSDPIVLGSRSADEDGYKHSAYIAPKNLDPAIFPAGLSRPYTLNLTLDRDVPPGRYPMLIKLFYNNQVLSAKFEVEIP